MFLSVFEVAGVILEVFGGGGNIDSHFCVVIILEIS